MNAGTQQVRLYDRDGTFLLAFGREGDGPGEFRYPLAIWQRGDSLVVYDARRQRLNWFTEGGVFIRDVALAPAYVNPAPVYLLDDGRAVAVDHVFRVPASGFADQPLNVIVHGADGQVRDTVGHYSFGQLGQVGPPGTSIVTGPIFQPQAQVAASHDRIHVARTVEREVEVLRPDGSVQMLVRWNGPDRTVTEDHIRGFREAELGRAKTPEQRIALLQRLDERPIAKRYPALVEMQVATDGRLWIREFDGPAGERPAQWIVFAADGSFDCRLQLPPRLQLLEPGSDYVIGMWRDEFDVEHVRTYSFE